MTKKTNNLGKKFHYITQTNIIFMFSRVGYINFFAMLPRCRKIQRNTYVILVVSK